MERNTCPVCGKNLNKQGQCPECGYDFSADVEQFDTLSSKLSEKQKTKTRLQEQTSILNGGREADDVVVSVNSSGLFAKKKVLAAAAVLLVLAGVFEAGRLTAKVPEPQTSAAEIQTTEEILTSEPGAIQTEAPTVVEEETFLPFDMTSFDYAYSDDLSDNAMYTAKEFAEEILTSEPGAIQTEAPTVVEEEMFLPFDMTSFDYAYSDDLSDNAMYTAKEFAEVVKSENVRELLPLGTRIKMAPNSKEITDEFIEFELVAYKHFEQADGSGMAKTTWLAVNLLNEKRTMNENWTNAGGWRDSELRGWLNETLYPSLPSYWKNLMVQVAVSSTAGKESKEIVTSADYLFLPAIGEMDKKYLTKSENSVFYSSEISSDAEERTFIRFTDEDVTRVKKRQGNSSFYWLRSPSVSSAAIFYSILSSGTSGYYGYSPNSYGVCPGFCM